MNFLDLEMGKSISSLRYVKNFNIENRAQRVIGSEKPLTQSPRHPSTARRFEEIESKQDSLYLFL